MRREAPGHGQVVRDAGRRRRRYHDVDRVGRRRRDPRQVHAGRRARRRRRPALKWTQVPPGTQSFVLLMHDPEPVAPAKSSKMDMTHWLIWNIPATSTGLAEGVAAGRSARRQPAGEPARERLHGARRAGPGPYHHYTFKLYALDTKIDVRRPPQKAADTRTALDQRDGRARPRQGRPRGALPPVDVTSPPTSRARTAAGIPCSPCPAFFQSWFPDTP